jgi:hypothetical protein
MEDLPDDLTRLSARLETLERRVYVLEHPSELPSQLSEQEANPAQEAQSSGVLPIAKAGSNFSVVGKAMLGIAGAYLLRAAAESGTFPKLAIVGIAFAYACMWLLWATRLRAVSWFASTTYASTSALILAPMLWELTLRFKVLPTPVTAGLLSAFVVAASALAWKRNLASVFWVANVTAVLASLALILATHDMVPFICALLLMALTGEFAAGFRRWLSVRPLVAAAADLAILALLYIYSGATIVGTDYKGVSAAVLMAPAFILFVIYAASDAFQTAVLRQRITFFEIGQTTIAFLLAAVSVLHFRAGIGTTILGVICLLLSAAGYAAVYVFFDGKAEQRNFNVYATGSAALFLAGSFLCLSSVWLALCLVMATIIATFLGRRGGRLALEFHGLVYLAAAAFASGLMDYARRVLAGTFPAAPSWIIWVVSLTAILVYTVVARLPGEQWQQRLLRLVSAILAVGATVALLVSAVVWLTAFGIAPSTSHVAVIRTLTTCAVALILAYSGSRWHRIELVWIAYGTLALVAVKLLFEDLRYSHPAFTAASIFLYAVSLILVPHLVRMGQKV